jgi:hypothetical protein
MYTRRMTKAETEGEYEKETGRVSSKASTA